MKAKAEEIIITDELREAYDTLLERKKKYNRVKEHLEPLEMEILSKAKLSVDKTIERVGQIAGTPITDLSSVYLASNEDIQRFCDLCDIMYKEQGYKMKKGFSPILVAKKELVTVENDFIDKSFYLVSDTGLKRERLDILSARRKYLKATVELLSKIIKREDGLAKKMVSLYDEVKKHHGNEVKEIN